MHHGPNWYCALVTRLCWSPCHLPSAFLLVSFLRICRVCFTRVSVSCASALIFSGCIMQVPTYQGKLRDNKAFLVLRHFLSSDDFM